MVRIKFLGADANNEKSSVSGWLEDSNEDLIPLFKTIKTKEFNMYRYCQRRHAEGPSFDLYAKNFGRSQRNKN
jgi:phosphoribosylformimino-5-aminoimidazole carboxamide ribotide isomerase